MFITRSWQFSLRCSIPLNLKSFIINNMGLKTSRVKGDKYVISFEKLYLSNISEDIWIKSEIILRYIQMPLKKQIANQGTGVIWNKINERCRNSTDIEVMRCGWVTRIRIVLRTKRSDQKKLVKGSLIE